MHIHLFLKHTHSQNMKIDFTEKNTQKKERINLFLKKEE